MTQIFGWKNVEELSREVVNHGFSGLFSGPLVFAYKNTGKSGTIKVLIISKRLHDSGYIVGEIPFSEGWTGFLPNVSPVYLEEAVYPELIKNKTEKEILEAFIANVEYYERKQ
jgi:hypothetical protein